LSLADLEMAGPVDGVACRALLSLDLDAAPADVLLNLDELDLSSHLERLEAAGHLVLLKLGRFVHDHLPWRPSSVAALVEGEASCHHTPHFGVAEEGVVTLDMDIVG